MKQRKASAQRAYILSNGGANGGGSLGVHHTVKELGHFTHLGFLHAACGQGRRAEAKPARDHRRARVVWNAVLVDDNAGS